MATDSGLKPPPLKFATDTSQTPEADTPSHAEPKPSKVMSPERVEPPPRSAYIVNDPSSASTSRVVERFVYESGKGLSDSQSPYLLWKKRTVPPSVSTASKMLENVTSPKVAESIEIEKVTGIVSRPAMAVEPPAAIRRVESARECVRVMVDALSADVGVIIRRGNAGRSVGARWPKRETRTGEGTHEARDCLGLIDNNRGRRMSSAFLPDSFDFARIEHSSVPGPWAGWGETLKEA